MGLAQSNEIIEKSSVESKEVLVNVTEALVSNGPRIEGYNIKISPYDSETKHLKEKIYYYKCMSQTPYQDVIAIVFNPKSRLGSKHLEIISEEDKLASGICSSVLLKPNVIKEKVTFGSKDNLVALTYDLEGGHILSSFLFTDLFPESKSLFYKIRFVVSLVSSFVNFHKLTNYSKPISISPDQIIVIKKNDSISVKFFDIFEYVPVGEQEETIESNFKYISNLCIGILTNQESLLKEKIHTIEKSIKLNSNPIPILWGLLVDLNLKFGEMTNENIYSRLEVLQCICQPKKKDYSLDDISVFGVQLVDLLKRLLEENSFYEELPLNIINLLNNIAAYEKYNEEIRKRMEDDNNKLFQLFFFTLFQRFKYGSSSVFTEKDVTIIEKFASLFYNYYSKYNLIDRLGDILESVLKIRNKDLVFEPEKNMSNCALTLTTVLDYLRIFGTKQDIIVKIFSSK